MVACEKHGSLVGGLVGVLGSERDGEFAGGLAAVAHRPDAQFLPRAEYQRGKIDGLSEDSVFAGAACELHDTVAEWGKGLEGGVTDAAVADEVFARPVGGDGGGSAGKLEATIV